MTNRHDDDLNTWGKVKRFNASYPKSSRVLWFALALAIVAGGVIGVLAGRNAASR
jgi:hypothetical protein